MSKRLIDPFDLKCFLFVVAFVVVLDVGVVLGWWEARHLWWEARHL